MILSFFSIVLHHRKQQRSDKLLNSMKKQVVKILGQEVTVGTKAHAKLVAQVKHFNDLQKSETC